MSWLTCSRVSLLRSAMAPASCSSPTPSGARSPPGPARKAALGQLSAALLYSCRLATWKSAPSFRGRRAGNRSTAMPVSRGRRRLQETVSNAVASSRSLAARNCRTTPPRPPSVPGVAELAIARPAPAPRQPDGRPPTLATRAVPYQPRARRRPSSTSLRTASRASTADTGSVDGFGVPSVRSSSRISGAVRCWRSFARRAGSSAPAYAQAIVGVDGKSRWNGWVNCA